MNEVQLVIGNRNYSSWSLRAWLPLRKSGIEFETVVLPLDCPEFEEKIADYSPTRKVPVLWHGGQCIWDSLAIAEYCNEAFAAGRLWPEEPASRALGRSMAAEMHSGFPELRARMPMNCRARNRQVPMDAPLTAEIERVWTLWSDALSCHADSGPWLLGAYSLADAMFAPVVLRFATYGVELPVDIASYCQAVLDDADLQEWVALAGEEEWVVAADEAGSD